MTIKSNGGVFGRNPTFNDVNLDGTLTISDKIVHAGDVNTSVRFPADDTVTVETSGFERLRVNSSGNVGIGTNNPDTLLRVNGLTRTTALQTTGQELLPPAAGKHISLHIVADSYGDLYAYDRTAGAPISLSLQRTGGNVGIGTATPDATLRVIGIARSTAIQVVGQESAVPGSGKRISLHIVADSYGDLYAYDNTAGASINLILQRNGGNVGIGTAAPNAASILDAQSTTKGVRFPNMTTAQKNLIANVAGNVIFDTTLGKLCVNTGAGWQTITSV